PGFLCFGESLQKSLIQCPRSFDCLLETFVAPGNLGRILSFAQQFHKPLQFRASSGGTVHHGGICDLLFVAGLHRHDLVKVSQVVLRVDPSSMVAGTQSASASSGAPDPSTSASMLG